jgi:hypothetical protein
MFKGMGVVSRSSGKDSHYQKVKGICNNVSKVKTNETRKESQMEA